MKTKIRMQSLSNTAGFAIALACGALGFALGADADNLNLPNDRATITTPAPPSALPPKNNNAAIDCSRFYQDPRCRATPAPPYRPYPYHRPVIVNTAPPPPPIDISSLKDDWDGCRSTKLNAIHSRRDGNLEQANRLDEWLWRNCRAYSNDLRDLEQDEM